MAAPHRIDTHTHILPPDYAAWLKRKSADAGGLPIPDWSVIKVILSHAGGFVPYASHRIAITTSTSNVANGLAQLRSFYYDIALSGSPPRCRAYLRPRRPITSCSAPTSHMHQYKSARRSRRCTRRIR